MKHYTEGIAFDGAAILEDGKPITITQILNLLNEKKASKKETKVFTKEEILIRFLSESESYFDIETGIIDGYDAISTVLKAMDEYAQQQVKTLVCEFCDGWGYTVDEKGRRKEHCYKCT